MRYKNSAIIIALIISLAATTSFAQPNHSILLYSHSLENGIAPGFAGFENYGGLYRPGQGWEATTQNSQLKITLPGGLSSEGTFTVDVKNFNPVIQNVSSKQQIINLYSQSNGSKDIFHTNGSWFNIRTGTEYSDGPGVAGFKFFAAPCSVSTRQEIGCMQSATWNINTTYRFKVVWNEEKIWILLNDILLGELAFINQVEPFRYIFLGKDNVYVGQPGPIYSNLRIYGGSGGGVMGINFTDITASSNTRGFSASGYHHGSSWADVNKDGLYDLFVSNAPGVLFIPDLLFINQGSLVFQNEAAARGTYDDGSTHSIVNFDMDNDGDLDVLTSNMPVGDNYIPSVNRLYQNDGSGYYAEVTEWAGLSAYQNNSRGIIALDVENDGDLDLYVNGWKSRSQLFLNNGSGQFILVERGCEGSVSDVTMKQGVTAADVDNDGDIDIYVSRREANNWLFINDGSGYFTEEAAARGVNTGGRTHGASFVDVDNDADFDLYVANFGFPNEPLPLLGVYINNGLGYFTNRTSQFNYSVSAYTPAFGDVDNDADMDLYLIKNDEKEPGAQPVLFINDGLGNLSPVANTGLEVPALDARGASYADMDNDGDIDFYVTSADSWNWLLRNDTADSNNYIDVLCIGPGGDYGGFGTRVYVYENGHLGDNGNLLGFQQSVSSTAYLVQNQTALHFGLGDRTACDIRIVRTDGVTFDYPNIGVNQLFEMQPGIPRIVTSFLPVGNIGVSYNAYLQANGGVTPYTWDIIVGALPPGLSLNSATGAIHGTPVVDGIFAVTVEMRDSQSPQSIDTKVLQIQITPIPELEIVTTTLPDGTVGYPYETYIEVTGGVSPYLWSINSGYLPPGIYLNSDTGSLSGTPTQSGSFEFQVLIRDSHVPYDQITGDFRIEVAAQPTIDEEFITGSFYGYTQYIPLTGPAFSLTARPDWFRLTVPSQKNYYHWSSTDDAPQLKRPLPNGAGNWQVETRLDLNSVSGTNFHVGLCVYFSQYDLYYWGFLNSTTMLKCSRSGYGGLISKTYSGGRIVDLRIRKEGTQYYFEYKTPSSAQWILAGVQSNSLIPQDIVLLARTWENIQLVADFDYLRLRGENIIITTENLPKGYLNVPYSTTLQAQRGESPYDWNLLSGFLPTGMTLNEETGEIYGLPTETGVWDFSIEVRDTQIPHASATQLFSLQISTIDPLEILTLSLPNGVIDVPYDQSLLARGGIPPYFWNVVAGVLPNGLTLNVNTGQISGTPTLSNDYIFTIRLSDSQLPIGETNQMLTMTITILAEIDEEFETGSFAGYTKYIPKSGPSINLTEHRGWLRIYTPPSAKFDHWSSIDEAPQLRRPIPAGDWQIETLVDLIYNKGSLFQTGLMVYFSRYDIFYWGFKGDKTVLKMAKAGGGAVVTATYSGGRQVELRIRKLGNTYYFDYRKPGDMLWTQAGVQSYTKTPASVGLITKTWEKVDMVADFDYLRLNDDHLTILTNTLPMGQLGISYDALLNGEGGLPPYSWLIVSGALPDGVLLNSTTGQLNGTPTTLGTFNFTAQLTDSQMPHGTATRDLNIEITSPGALVITTTSLINGSLGAAYDASLSATGGLPPYEWSITSGSLPDGLTLDSATGAISGTPTTTGTVNFTTTVKDSDSPQNEDTQDLSLTISIPPPVDEEFITGNLDGYVVYKPVTGPDINVTDHPNWVRFHLPAGSSYDYWTDVDRAPQLRRNILYTNWQIETRLELIYTMSTKYNAALIVYFAPDDIYYWGFSCSTNRLRLARTGTGGLVAADYGGGVKVDLRIRKIGTTYHFEYKIPSSSTWIDAGQTTTATVPTQVGLLVKTWDTFVLTCDFDFLRMTEITTPAASGEFNESNTSDAFTQQLEIPDNYSLSQNYPNPFNPATSVKLNLPESRFTEAVIYNIRGEQIRMLVQNVLSAGSHELVWDSTDDFGRPVNSGLYFMQVHAGPIAETRKLLLVR